MGERMRAGERGAVASALALLVVFLVAVAGACQETSTQYDPFPVPLDLNGAVVVQGAIDESTGDAPGGRFDVVVDTLSPLTVIDSFDPDADAEAQAPSRERMTISLLGQGADAVPRVRYVNASVFDLHPCPQSDGPDVACEIGMDGAQRVIRGVVGADLLSRTALQLDFSAGILRLFPDIAGSASERAALCDAVFDAPFHGGGTLLIGGAEISYSGRRIALGACLSDDRTEPADGPRRIDSGVDMLMLVSTGMDVTLLSESSYQRYRLASGDADAAPFASLPTTRLFMPSGPITVRPTTVATIALVGEQDDARGPCAERYANYYFYRNPTCGRVTEPDGEGPCPCQDDDAFCRTGAVLEIGRDAGAAPATRVAIAVVPDGEPLLHALRNELRPGLPEVDGIVGIGALADAVVDVDYPNGRVLARCPGAGCTTRPAVISEALVVQTQPCVTAQLQ